MKTITNLYYVRRVSDEVARQLVDNNSGYNYCPKSVWKQYRDAVRIELAAETTGDKQKVIRVPEAGE